MEIKPVYEKEPVRKYLDQALTYLGGINPDVMLLTDDLRDAIQCESFIAAYPDRFLDMGIAEQNMMGMAAGLASCGKTPFVVSYATFATLRVAEQLRNDVAYTGFGVKVVSLTTGVQFGQGGMSHQTYEDVAFMRTLPNFSVIVPADPKSTYKAVLAAAAHEGPVFIRGGRDDEYLVYGNEHNGFEFTIGGSNVLAQGKDIALVACGFMVHEALVAAEILQAHGVSATVVDLYSIKPIDKNCLLDIANNCKAIMTIEEHFTTGGLGSAVLEAYSGRQHPPLKLKGINDAFPPIGPKFELREHLGLCADSIAKDAMELLESI